MLTFIVAIGDNFAIGKNNDLLWHFSKDLKRFKQITSGNTIIMGRKTFESLPGILPSRHHIVITKNKDFVINDERVTIFNSKEELLAFMKDSEEYFVIGGGAIYKLLLPYCSKIHLTKVHKEYNADIFFPKLDYSEWNCREEETGFINDDKTTSYTFLTLERIINEKQK
ncbi:dihydrofolate reductase [Clostridium estertheticum]|uniref:Dihydrofolate reductase n=1 Tax=Clostridium estertheticum TaxID=238834 RepID=A0A7Y3T0H1_9CLOT|nr:dihydrofolate reductase [Clostridium estertheticum]MBW9173627.1 dihydrofolate reductase [Clostridium estertheticum]MCB2353895.1 dihydrofolate reductase [Clostridium estertheticum]NNU77842.1 dihydrofolate reductase [Clostridium estertheticum]WAG43038.1 dihydrofolate reductase [Clostridium estertheticum]WBL46111.1 dihydrofolate reductase [Clostridium estertheticum]